MMLAHGQLPGVSSRYTNAYSGPIQMITRPNRLALPSELLSDHQQQLTKFFIKASNTSSG